MSTAYVLGNGTSRKDIALDNLKNYGKVYGCNALYREYDPDYLIAVDAKMIFEIARNNYQLTHSVWTNPNRTYSKIKGLNLFEPSKGWSSGPTALDLASTHGHSEIYILGFDFQGLDEKLNNIYANTPNYKKSTDNATYYGNWTRQTYMVISKNPKKRYIRVVTKEQRFVPKDYENLSNLAHISVDEFKNLHGL